MKNFQKICASIDVEPLLRQIESRPELWDAYSRRKTEPGSPHSRMSDIWVRYNAIDRLDGPDPRQFHDEHVPVWYPAFEALPALRRIIFDLMALVEGEMIGGVLITRIPPGEKIEPHIDYGWHVEQYEKFYISLQNEPKSVFGCEHNGETEILSPLPGECWLFDNRKLHWVTNDSGKDRLTLIVCIRRPPCHSPPLEQP